MSEHLLTGILIFCMMQSILFAILSSTKKKKLVQDKLMGIWLFILAIQTFLIVVNMQAQTMHILIDSPLLITLLYGPLLFLYISKLTKIRAKLSIIDFFHFIPFILFLSISFLYPVNRNLFTKSLAAVSCLSGIVYCLVTYFQLRNHKKNIVTKFSNIENINLKWVSKLVIGLLFIWCGVILLVVLKRFLYIELSLNWFFTIVPVFIFYLGYNGISQQVIYPQNRESSIDVSVEIQRRQKSYENSYKKSGLQLDSMKTIYDKLVSIMQNDKLYLNPTLSLSELSEAINSPAHNITQTLNEYGRINFYDFVNSFRVDAVKIKMESEDAQKFTLLAIAFDCGFNSKSSFNRIFKSYTGKSPSEYKKNTE